MRYCLFSIVFEPMEMAFSSLRIACFISPEKKSKVATGQILGARRCLACKPQATILNQVLPTTLILKISIPLNNLLHQATQQQQLVLLIYSKNSVSEQLSE